MENIITEKLDMFYLNEKERKPFSIFEKEGIEIEELFEHIDVDLILQEGLTDISKNLVKKMADSVNSAYKDPKKAKQVAKKYERIVSKVTPQKLDNIISRLSKETDVSDSEIKKAKIDIKRALGAIALGVGSISSNILTLVLILVALLVASNNKKGFKQTMEDLLRKLSSGIQKDSKSPYAKVFEIAAKGWAFGIIGGALTMTGVGAIVGIPLIFVAMIYSLGGFISLWVNIFRDVSDESELES